MEAKEHNENAIGVYKPATKQSDLKEMLAGHVPIELSHLLKYFLDTNADNELFANVTEKRKREVGLVVPEKLSLFTMKVWIAEVLER